MLRTQIQLTDEQALALTRAAEARGVSIAALISQILDRSLRVIGDDSRQRRAMGAVGRYSSGRRDVADQHDRHLADAFSG